MLTTDRVLTYPNPTKPYVLYTDASDYGIGAILVQEVDGIERPIHFVSKTLTTEQRRWSTIEKEAYAIVHALQKLRPYLWGAKFEVRTDHKPLLSLFKNPIKNAKITRWAILLSEYACPIVYCPGKQNAKADLLSRIQPLEQQICVLDTAEDNSCDLTPTMAFPLLADGIDLKTLREHQQSDFAEEIEDALNSDDSEFIISDGLLYSIRRPCRSSLAHLRLMLPRKFRKQVIARCHDDIAHLGVAKTLCQVRADYVWPGMRKDIDEFIKMCATCEVHKKVQYPQPMHIMPDASYPFQIIGIDLVGPFVPSAKSNAKYLLTVIDHCTGFVEAIPIRNPTAAEVMDGLMTHVISRYSIPEIVISDNGTCFTAHEIQDWMKQLGIEHRRSTSYHPQTNGKIERFHRTLKSLLAKLINNDHRAWESVLPSVLMAYRIAISEVTGYSPHYLLFGKRPRAPLTKLLADNCPTFGNRLDNLRVALRVARENTAIVRARNKARLDKKAKENRVEVGDHVTITANPSVSLGTKRDPLFIITKVRGSVCWCQHQQTGKVKVVNLEKVRVVSPDVAWEGINPRPRRLDRTDVNETVRDVADRVAHNDDDVNPMLRDVADRAINHNVEGQVEDPGQDE